MSKRAIVVLLLLLAFVLLGSELFARFIVQRHSKVEAMMLREHSEALQLRPGKDGQPRQLLIVGNSFAGMDLDLPVLQTQLAPAWKVHRYWAYNTLYHDWYYGLKRLLNDGSRPDAIAVTFIAISFYRSGIRGDYSSYYLFQPRDLPALQADANLDNTETANLLFARYSRYYGLRSEIRKVFLQSLMPGLPRMYDLLRPAESHPLGSEDVLSTIAPRIAKMQRLTAPYGVRLILIVPPLPGAGQEFHKEILAAASAAHVPVVMPYSAGDLPRELFLDDVHLSPRGATRFSTAVAPLLLQELGGGLQPPPNTSNLDRDHSQPPVISRPAALAVQTVP